MPTVLHGEAIREEIRKILQKGTPAYAVAPFWGKHARKALGLEKGDLTGRLDVLCDIFAGTTYPAVIRDLLNRGARVRVRGDIHAKAFFNDSAAVVGSANVSLQALGDGRTEPAQHELCVSLTNEASLNELLVWWKALWAEAQPLEKGKATTKQLLEHAEFVRTQRSKASEVLYAWRRAPADFTDAYVTVDWIPLDDVVEEQVDARNAEHKGMTYGAWREWPDMPKEKQVISFASERPMQPVDFDGIWLTPKDPKPDEYGAVYVSELTYVCGYTLGDKGMWVNAARKFQKDLRNTASGVKNGGGILSLTKFVKKYLSDQL